MLGPDATVTMTLRYQDRAARPEGQGASSSATRRSSRRRTRAAIRSSSRAATARVVEDVDGNVFLDCAAGIAVNSTGHSHPDVVKAITEQAQQFLHMSGTDFYYEPQVRLAEELAAIAPIDGGARSFFGNSGTEAIEACIKLARYATGRHEHHRVPRRRFTAARWARCR